MGTRIRFCFLFLCAILFQVIIASSEENIKKSSDLHRKKRAIGETSDPNRKAIISPLSYIVSLTKKGVPHCAGTILSANVVLTAAHCVFDAGMTINVLAGSANRHFGTFHTVKNLQMYPGFNPNSLLHDLALLYIVPPINIGGQSYSQGIPLYNGPIIRPGTRGIFSGWGCTTEIGNRTIHPEQLRSIEVSILSPFECHESYPEYQQHICTGGNWGPEDSCSSFSGGPFTVDGKLVGIMSLHKRRTPILQNPAEFVNLAHLPYRRWIISTVRNLQYINKG